MIPVSQQWALMIDVCTYCHLRCSNCTRFLGNGNNYFMSPDCFRRALEAIKDFPRDSDPVPQREGERFIRRKVIGLIGGEPLLHPELPEIADIFCELVPEIYYRGFWTSRDWKTGSHPKWGPYRPVVEKIIGPHPTHDVRGPSERHACGFLNWNMHLPQMHVHHQPLLVAIGDMVPDERERWEQIEGCWVQREWSGTCTDQGFYFCEVAAHFDRVFGQAVHGGYVGLPFEPGAWRGELTFERDADGVPRPQGKFAEQINRWCERCGACLRMPGRRDHENTDDVSAGNLPILEAVDSPRLKRDEVVVHEPSKSPETVPGESWRPMEYVKGPWPKDQSAASRREANQQGV